MSIDDLINRMDELLDGMPARQRRLRPPEYGEGAKAGIPGPKPSFWWDDEPDLSESAGQCWRLITIRDPGAPPFAMGATQCPCDVWCTDRGSRCMLRVGQEWRRVVWSKRVVLKEVGSRELPSN